MHAIIHSRAEPYDYTHHVGPGSILVVLIDFFTGTTRPTHSHRSPSMGTGIIMRSGHSSSFLSASTVVHDPHACKMPTQVSPVPLGSQAQDAEHGTQDTGSDRQVLHLTHERDVAPGLRHLFLRFELLFRVVRLAVVVHDVAVLWRI